MKTLNKEELRELYDKDYPLWAEINLELLREKLYDLVDWDNLLEEIDDMAKTDLKTCISHLAIILEHLYKLDNFKDLAGGETAGKSWIRSIKNSRVEIEVLFEYYPSLKSKLPLEMDKAWLKARKKLEIWLEDNNLDPRMYNIPQNCPYSFEEVMNRKV